MSVNSFFNEFIGAKASFGFDVFSKEILSNTQVEYSSIEQSKDESEGFVVFKRKLTAIVPIKDVPFCTETHLEKSMRIERPRP